MVVALAFVSNAAGEAPKCKLMRIAEWTVRSDHYLPVVDGEINGKKIGVLIDTGASHDLIVRSVAARLGLPREQLQGVTFVGIGGESHAEAVRIAEFRIGKQLFKNLRAIVAGEQDWGDDLAVILSEDFLRKADVEFDLRNNAVRLYQPKDCAGERLAYWSTQALDVPLQRDDKIVLTVAINGKPLRALLDSGASRSLLARVEAAERGVTPDSPGAEPGGCVRGLGAKSVDTWTAPFDTFAIGDQLIRNPRIRFADMWQHGTYTETGSRLLRQSAGKPQMLLGADFLRSHRVLVARSQSKMYFSYEGGTVFSTFQVRACGAAPDKAKSG